MAFAISAAALAEAQPLAQRTLELDGETLHYTVRTFAPEARLSAETAATLEPTSALSTAQLLKRYLATGRIEDAALLSNAPRRRFEVLREYQHAVGEGDFKQVFTQYFYPENRLVAEIIIERHSLLVWHLHNDGRYAGQYYVDVEGRVLLDDAPSEARSRLRRILEAIRSGRIPLPIL
ncbi:MAG: hypothetical protein EXR29_06235 [Betaproteobacteria bacterium]|nr:hypothetical protein [Betaproteobacteria bacterium]